MVFIIHNRWIANAENNVENHQRRFSTIILLFVIALYLLNSEKKKKSRTKKLHEIFFPLCQTIFFAMLGTASLQKMLGMEFLFDESSANVFKGRRLELEPKQLMMYRTKIKTHLESKTRVIFHLKYPKLSLDLGSTTYKRVFL